MKNPTRSSVLIRWTTAAAAACLLFSGCTGGDPEPVAAAVPSGLPTEVRVVEGTVANQVAAPEGGSWSFSVAVADAAGQRQAVDELIAAGWEVTGSNEAPDRSTFTLSDGARNATLVLTEVDGHPTVVYNIVDLAAG